MIETMEWRTRKEGSWIGVSIYQSRGHILEIEREEEEEEEEGGRGRRMKGRAVTFLISSLAPVTDNINTFHFIDKKGREEGRKA